MNPIELDRALRKLRLSGMANVLETRLRQAQSEKLAPIDLVSALVSDELVRRQAHRRRGSTGADHAPLRARLDDPDVESGRRLGQAARRHRRRHRAARPAAPPRPRHQVRPAQLANKNPRRFAAGAGSEVNIRPSRTQPDWPLLTRPRLAGFDPSTEDSARLTRDPRDQSAALQLDNHVVDAGWRNAEGAPHVRLNGRAAVDQRVLVDEGQVLALGLGEPRL